MRGGKRKGAGRKPGAYAKRIRKQSTVCLFPEEWEFLYSIGASPGKGISKLIKFWQENKDGVFQR